MTPTVGWSGDRDGVLIVRESGAEERVIDRIGDAVILLQDMIERREPGRRAVAAYALCLATRGITQPGFVHQILEKSYPFVAGAGPTSRLLYEVLERLRACVAASERSGAELRDELLREAHAILSEGDEDGRTAPLPAAPPK